MAWKKASMDMAPIWEKVKEKTVEGVLVDKREHVGQYDSTVFTLEKKGGEKVAVFAKNMLETQLKALAMGTIVRITWKGLVKTKNGRNANSFDVEYDDSAVTPEDKLVSEAEKIFSK